MSEETNIDATLQERESRYGDFPTHAKITQDVKRAMMQGNWGHLADDQRECLEMIAHKIGRVLNGDPDYHDSWHDIVGYAKLVADRLAPDQAEPAMEAEPDAEAKKSSLLPETLNVVFYSDGAVHTTWREKSDAVYQMRTEGLIGPVKYIKAE